MTSRDYIIGVQFGLNGSEENAKKSNFTVKNNQTYKDQRPATDGVYDLHLGSTEMTMGCLTCGLPGGECLGHMGIAELATAVVQPMTLGQVTKWLKIICHNCGRSHSCDSTFEKCLNIMKRQQASKKKEQIICIYCHKPQRIYSQNDNKVTWSAEKRDSSGAVKKGMDLLPSDVLEIFQKVRPETMTTLGLEQSSHPKTFFLKNIVIPAVTIRPEVRRIGGNKSTSDNATKMIAHVMTKNNEIANPGSKEESAQKGRKNFRKKIQTVEEAVIELNCYFHQFVKGPISRQEAVLNNQDGNPMESLANRTKSKQGLFRKYLLGKRCRDLARSTITGNPRMRIDDLLYPLSFVKTIPKRERLQAYNETRLRGFIANAKIGKYPMAQRIIKSNGNQLSIKKLESGLVTFNYGDMLEYDSCDGDSINFNRQPTLEICSISCHSLRVNPNPINYTICMNVIACDFYNADFDGDEMNTHHAKYTYTRHEIKAISSFKNYVISHTTNSPQIGQINDSIVGLFELTRSSIKVSRETAMRLFANTTFFPHFTQEVYTGREIISLLLERTPINYSGRPSFYLEHLVPFMNYDSEEIHVEIKAGKMISGVLDAASIGSGGHKNVYHIIERDYGPEMMLETMFNMQQVSIDFIMQRGFSMGIKDVMLPKEARERIKLEESNMINESILISDKLNRGAIVAPIGKTQKEFFEAQQINVLQPTDVYNEIILQNIRKDENGLLSMILSGSKGKLNNLMAITARAGQQLINGERLRETFGYRRTQVYAVRFDKNPIAYGYITNSYISGQTGPEFYANACNARFDLITKALSTSVTGDKNRNAVKNMENTYVDHYRRSIRGFNVVQMLEGEDGLDPRRVERVKFPTVKMSVEEIRKNYAACPAEEIEGLVVDKIKFLEITKGLSGARVGRLPVVDRKIAFDAERIIKNKFGHEIMSRPIEYKNYQRIREWLDGTSNGPSNKKSTNHGLERVFVNTRYAGKIPEQYILGCTFAKIYLRSILATTHYGGRLKPEELESVLLEVETQYKESLIDPGTCIGIQAAQCISAPMTQYALDSHTRSASGGTSKGGMTRIQEVVGAQKTKSLSSPSMYLVPEMDVVSDKNTVQKIANMIEMMDLGRFVRRTDIYFEEYGNPVYPGTVKEAKDIEIFDGISAHKRPNDLINWVIRYELDKSKLILKGMSVSTIVKSLTEQNEEQYFMYTSDTSPVVYIRQYFRTIKKKTVTTDLMIELMNATKSQVIRGIPGIISASVVSHVYVDDQFNTNNGYAISTQGTNLLGALLVPGINPNLCHTNSISEVEEVFGICAARNKIIVELGEIVEKGDARHQIMYADEMTRIGKVVSIERPGFATREPTDILGRAALSSPMKAFMDGAINQVSQEISGVSSNLLLGQLPKVGTTYTEVLLNEKFVAANVTTADDYLDEL